MKVEIITRRNQRFYIVEGITRPMPSVTTILDVINKPALIGWANKMGRKAVWEALQPKVGEVLTEDALNQALEAAKAKPAEVAGEAKDYGKQAHTLIADIIRGGKTVPIPPELAPAIDGFFRWYDQCGLEIEFTERVLYSVQHGYFGGTVDAVARGTGKLAVIDWKTSSGLYDEYALQISAYAKAYEELFEEPVQEAWVVRFPKTVVDAATVPFEVGKVADIERMFGLFQCAKMLYEGLKEEVWDGGR